MFDRVLLQRAEAIAKTKGGIVIPEKAQQKVSEATVVAVGPGFRTEVSMGVEGYLSCWGGGGVSQLKLFG